MTQITRSAPNPGWWVPNTDVYISEDGHLGIEIELAAIKKEDFKFTVDANRIIVRGERLDGGRRQRCQYLVKELRYGPFESVLEIPLAYDPAQAKVAYQNGILRIDVPRKAELD